MRFRCRRAVSRFDRALWHSKAASYFSVGIAPIAAVVLVISCTVHHLIP